MGVSDAEEADDALCILPRRERTRNLVAYWFLGLCNNYAFVIMLSAAHDILSNDFQANSTDPTPIPITNNTRDCNPVSTGAILLADVLPSLTTKLVTPFLLTHTRLRVVMVIVLSSASFLFVSFSTSQWQAFLGVVFASFSGGLGEVTFLQYSSRYHKNVISTWSSGTGASGLLGALSFAALTSIGFTPRTTVLLMLVVPVLMSVTFFFILEHDKGRLSRPSLEVDCNASDVERLVQPEETPQRRSVFASLRAKGRIISRIGFRFIVPLATVYLCEYFINQGLLELIYFKDIWLNHHSQYRWLQVDYQLGVFLSRSSVNFYPIHSIWLLAFLQFTNVILLTSEAVFLFIPTIWIVFLLVLFEGLVAGAAYVNTFYRVAHESLHEEKAFSMGIVSLGGSVGVSAAGLLSVPFHDYLCTLPMMR